MYTLKEVMKDVAIVRNAGGKAYGELTLTEIAAARDLDQFAALVLASEVERLQSVVEILVKQLNAK